MRRLILISICVFLAGCSKETRFLDAAAEGDLQAVKKLLAEGVKVNHWDDGRTALSLAAKHGHTSVAAFLLKNGASPFRKHNNGRTALHEASEYGHKAIVSLLIQNKAEINLESDYANTPLSLAKEQNHEDVVKLLVDAGAKEKSLLRKKTRKLTKEEALKKAEESRKRYRDALKRYKQ